MKKSSLLGAGMMIVIAGFVFLFQEAIGKDTVGFSVVVKKDRLEILFATKKVADFVFADPKILRPYFSNMLLPSGLKVTRNHPPIAATDALDHDTMHPGIWLAFGDISGTDFWRNKGRIEHLKFVEEPSAGIDLIVFATESRLLTEAGKEICKMRNNIQMRARPSGYLLVWDAILKSDDADFSFGDQEEMGFGARIATALTEKASGVITSSVGLKSAKATWGKTASWCDYSSTKESKEGITLMASPLNFRESWWHNRDYGVFVANPFGRSAMKQGPKSLHTVKKAESFRIVFGAMLHEGSGYDAAKEFQYFSQIIK
ncbi:MAG: hypothetical protein EBT92_17495 [Planctomycetes bacterium]|nr:hypothetical protein [Planctomycetota bacterium]NBY00421.1 hypothetical protein [Planctomycetota bacterium]